MIKNIFILDISGSMSDAQIKKGMDIIHAKGILLSGREPPAIFCWSNLKCQFYQLVSDLREYYPESFIHLVGDEYFPTEDLRLVDQVTTITL